MVKPWTPTDDTVITIWNLWHRYLDQKTVVRMTGVSAPRVKRVLEFYPDPKGKVARVAKPSDCKSDALTGSVGSSPTLPTTASLPPDGVFE